ncbi:MAG TPA: arsinothricin resistance N-acetyltransferase ArsN1 family B [Myxococcota bacterium]|nr:arsinothricin resistance N-acetyltransferase ArsN1 family B [Myxococcota bacterium]
MRPVVRLAEPSDAAGVQAIYAPIVRDTAISFEVDPPSIEEMSRRIASTLQSYPYLVCDDDGEILGYVYGGRHRERGAYRWSVDVTVYIHERARRRGVGHALYSTLLPLLALQGFHRAYAGITLPNAGSVGLHEAQGFTPVGVYPAVGFKLGEWHDVGWWQLALRPPARNPAEPYGLDRAMRHPEWKIVLEDGQRLLDRRAGQAQSSSKPT